MIKQNRQINFGLTGDQFAHCLALNETPDWVSPTITGQIPILALKEKIQSNLLKKKLQPRTPFRAAHLD